ncbi:putative transport protein [Escherichia coli]|uniref:Putative transport protein n=1 Tax=Escherichia coli TaxID=562 RepID=A0A376X761_ECOLX|nr:putative transport protein [Escherichia coli]
MLILLAGNGTTYMPLEGIQLIQKAMRVLMGSWGAEFVTLVVILFAFSSIVANYIYAENNLFFLRLNNPKAIWCLRICTFATVIGGTLAKPSADVATGRYHNGLHGYYQFDRHFTALACGSYHCQ